MRTNRPLLVAAHVPSSLRIPLRSAVGEEHHIAEAVNWSDLSQIVRYRPVDLIVADPQAEGDADMMAVADVIRRFPRTPVLVYTSLEPNSVGAVADLARRGLQNIVLHRLDDAPERFHLVLERAAKKQAGHQILGYLAESLDQLVPELARVVTEIFEQPHAFNTVADIATASKINLSRVYRLMRAAGIRAPRRLIVAARVLRAHAYMREPGYTVYKISKQLGYNHPRIFARHTYSTLGVKPRQLRRRFSDEALVERLVEWIYDEHAHD